MRRCLEQTAFGMACLAATILIMATLAVPTQMSGAECPGGGCNTAVCTMPNNVTCTNNATCDPTDCNMATKGERCDTADDKCICRFGNVSKSCTCGYVLPE